MNDTIKKLLEPVSADQPCGPDLTYDSRFEELETLLKGKPEVDFGNIKKEAEPPDWRELGEKATAFLQASKHLRGATILCCSLLKTRGLEGFCDGVQLLRGLLDQYWPTLYPLLDPEDNNDPTARLNILSALTAPRGTVTGWLAFGDYLYTTPLCQPRGAAPVTFEQIQIAKLRAGGEQAEATQGPDLTAVGALLRAGAAQLAENHKRLKEAVEAVQGIDQFLTTALSAGKTMSFEDLKGTLAEITKAIEPYLAADGNGADTATAAGQGPALAIEGRGTGTVIAVSGPIRSREDVVRGLDQMCQYYDQAEPGSPVPYLLRRAQKLANMNFVEAVQELNLVTDPAMLRPSMGSAVDGAAVSAPAPEVST